jgi:UDP-N-acetylglucosamine--N-acetylmuramyl-(pentapeptide) pyrophosphoryl-undecaprenol N-acetylglucosamine transferase
MSRESLTSSQGRDIPLKRVYIGIFGSGLGHAVRMLSVSKALMDEGCELDFSSSREATWFLRKQGYRCNDLPLVDVVFTETGSFSAKETMKLAPFLFARLYQQVGMEGRNLIRFKPDVVLSDSVLSTVMASKLLGLKTVTVLNQLKLVSSPKTPRIAAKLLSTGSITVGNEFWEFSDKVLLPDLPPPYTISESNLWGAGSVSSRAKYIGFLTPPRSDFVDAETAKITSAKGTRKLIFWQISGPPKTRTTLLSKARRLAGELRDDYLSLVSAGNPLGSTSPSPIEGGYLYDWCPSKDFLIDRCDVVVSRAGHVTIGDLILRQRPSILVPITAHSEQTGNATKAEKLGVAVKIEEPAITAGSFREAAERLETADVRRRTSELAGYAARFDAVGSIVGALRS